MSRIVLLILAGVITSLLIMPPAEAKRFGGGMNFGKSYKYSRPAKPVRPAPSPGSAGQAAPTRAGSAPGGGRRGGLLGPLAGLAAGGLLGALLFGGAFEGFQLFDFLVIGLLAWLGISLFRRFAAARGGAGMARTAPAGGPAPLPPVERGTTRPRSGEFLTPEIGSGLKGEPLAVRPDWFDESAFMAEVENHFRTLQEAWDQEDMSLIQSYVTPEMYTRLVEERAGLPEPPHTEVVALDARLLDLLQDGDDVVAAILFSGTIKENYGPPEPFAEVWHVRHPLNKSEGEWRIAGIRQYLEQEVGGG